MSLIHYEKDFDSLISKKAVVDFYADWCGPCKMFAPVFEEVAKEKSYDFIKINVDTYPGIAREYGIMTIPTIILFDDKEEVKRNVGFMNKDDFEEFLK